MGTSSQTMALYITSLELIEPLCGAQASVDDIAASVVSASYKVINASWATTGDGSAALSQAAAVANLYSQSYTAGCLSGARRRAMRRRLHTGQVQRTAEELQPLFDSVSKVSTQRVKCGSGTAIQTGRELKPAQCIAD